MILRETAVIIAAGVVVGVPAAIALSRLVSAMLFGIQPGDPRLIIGCAAALFAVGIAAALAPASKACQVDPMIALRHE
jgi:ABC-type antimicrobial peptide transport system permease subunit